MRVRGGLPISAPDATKDSGSNYSWQTENYLIALKVRGGLFWSATARFAASAAKPNLRDASDDAPIAPSQTVVVGTLPNGDGFAVAAGTVTAVVEPLVMASLCDLLYDDPGQPSKQDWTPEQWNAALQQQSWTASWRFLAESSVDPRVYFGVAFENAETGQIVIANRGTQTAYDVFVSDLAILRGIVPPAFFAAEQFAAQVVLAYQGTGQEIFVTGHSLGGADAEFQAASLGLPGTTFAALGVEFAAPGSAVDLINYLYPQDAIANLAPHIGTVVYILPNGPVQLIDLLATWRFKGEGLHFINNYLEYFGAPGIAPITPTQFIEAVLLSEIVDIFSRGGDPALARLATAADDLLGSSAANAAFGFDELTWADASAAATLLSAGIGSGDAMAGAVADAIFGMTPSIPGPPLDHPSSLFLHGGATGSAAGFA